MRLLLLAAALTGLAALGSARDPLPDPVLKAAVAAETAYLTKTLEGGSVPKNAVKTVKTSAMLLALAARQGGNGALEEQALAVAAAVTAKDFAGAKAAAAKLSGAAGGKPGSADLATLHKFDLETLMSCFRPAKSGGLNIEADIRAQSKKLTDLSLAASVGARSALIADYTVKYPASGATGDKKAQWDKLSKEMGDLGTVIAAEAAKGDKADKALVEKKLKSLNVNCSTCHSAFRDN